MTNKNKHEEIYTKAKIKRKYEKTRKLAAKKAVETKTKKTIQKINNIHVRVNNHYSDKQLFRDAADELLFRGKFDPPTDRDIVNYIRHCLTSYECDLDELYNQVGRNEGFKIISKKVFKAIKKAYPKYAAECDQQLEEHLSR